VRDRSFVWVFLFFFGVVCSGAQRGPAGPSSGEEFVGVWSGTWEGAGGSGGFELTLETSKESGVAGRVSVTGEPTYKASFKALSFDGKKMNAKYDFPPNEADAEVALAATFDGNNAKGTWSLRTKADGNEVAAGTWSVTRK
jgi:hypothetical protein